MHSNIKVSLTFLCVLSISFAGLAQPVKVKQAKLTRFDLQSSALIKAPGEELSSVHYKSDVY